MLEPDYKITAWNGWLSPDGKFYACGMMEHITLATQIFADTIKEPESVNWERFMEVLGWVKIAGGEVHEPRRGLTQAQYDLVMEWHPTTGLKMPEWLQDENYQLAGKLKGEFMKKVTGHLVAALKLTSDDQATTEIAQLETALKSRQHELHVEWSTASSNDPDDHDAGDLEGEVTSVVLHSGGELEISVHWGDDLGSMDVHTLFEIMPDGSLRLETDHSIVINPGDGAGTVQQIIEICKADAMEHLDRYDESVSSGKPASVLEDYNDHDFD